MKAKQHIAVVMGGYSKEHEVSLKSGQFILDHLDVSKYEVYAVVILKEGWFLRLNNTQYPINKHDFSVIVNHQKISFDAIVNTIHGTPGEDGHLQAYWELLEIPYTGTSFYLSALTFSKKDTLSVLSKFNIPMATSLYINEQSVPAFETVVDSIGLPFFVKPNQSGSSLGVSKVHKLEEYAEALKFAFSEGSDVILEQFMNGREFSVGVIKSNGKAQAVGITEIISDNDFFDYDAKYLGKSTEVTPANLEVETSSNLKTLAEKIYELLNMTGIARLDFIMHHHQPHFIEINTNPGLSPQSIFPQQIAHAKISFTELLNAEIEAAKSRQLLWKKL